MFCSAADSVPFRKKLPNQFSASTVTNLTVCFILEDDSYYATYERLAAAVDLGISHANTFILPDYIRLKVAYKNIGPSCSHAQFSAARNILQLLDSGVTCDVFLGVTCPNTIVAVYGMAEYLDIPILGVPTAGAAVVVASQDQKYARLPLLIRTSFSMTDMTTCFNKFLTEYNYTHVSVLHDDAYDFFTLFGKLANQRFRLINPELGRNIFDKGFFSDQMSSSKYAELLQVASGYSRVFILLGHGNAVRQIMITANQLGLLQGEYLFLAVELFQLKYWGSIQFNQDDGFDDVAKEAYKSLLVLTMHEEPANRDVRVFGEEVKYLAKTRYNFTFGRLEQLDPVITAHYEAILLYAEEVVSMMKDGFRQISGKVMASRICGNKYDVGVAGPISIFTSGQRACYLDIQAFNTKSEDFETIWDYGHSNSTTEYFRREKNFTFTASPDGLLPVDVPVCGFRGEICLDRSISKGVLAAAIVVPLIAVVGLCVSSVVVFLKFRKMRQDYNPNWWKISTEDLAIKQNRTGSGASKRTLTSQSTVGTSALTGYSAYNCDILATHNGVLVALTDVIAFRRHPTPDIVKRLTQIKACVSPNLQKFVGLGLSSTGLCEFIVNEPCAKGSLTDILENEMIKLDWTFKNSLIKDIVFGMTYLHGTPICSHGYLNSHTCLVDARFTLKISDYGFPFFRKPADLQPPRASDVDAQRQYETLLWRAPELLRQLMPPEGTQKGDVYSFAIILQQIILRSGPFELPDDPLELSHQEIIQEVVAANIPPVRPRVPRAACSNQLYDLMERCWEEVPVERLTFPKIKDRLKRVIGDVGDNIVDLLFKRMEQYAADLEFKVAEKTQQFMEEKTRSEQLLGQLLPKLVAAALTRGEHVDPEAYESVTIFFSDIVGFTTISAAGSPMDVVSLLNGLYTFFDSVLERYDVYKVETIGDAYMVSSGLPVRNGNRHAAEIAQMALDLMKGIRLFSVPNRPTVALEIRAGVNSGPCVAGIVGLKMPRYCLFGDTVNVASRMESTGEPMKIQITHETKDLLRNIGGFVTTERGPVAVKGKGTLTTYWLLTSELEMKEKKG
ncbi:Atrial natriuretic peptide receptor 1 [Hypsibius exemplaris]|uniref:Guanylate cyclase n=1 Tax=Hypsibius exemplaris TaxID=2072580 RepID=A0A1W0WUQ9_HYPEX|nr:Atrial natriuretic peptide receptor 1 [Hypsibius exemplaris]